jgi:hypothetical protein
MNNKSHQPGIILLPEEDKKTTYNNKNFSNKQSSCEKTRQPSSDDNSQILRAIQNLSE